MAEFQEDNDSQTSGNGKFLINIDSNLNYIDYPNKMRCNPLTDLVIDLPPHNKDYFTLQLEAVKNYYESISDYDISYGIIEHIYQLNNEMSYYATSDQKIGLLFADTIQMAQENGDITAYINENNLSLDDVLFVVFHAGLGQEASQRFDPTIYDIKSAYVDSDMLDDISGDNSYWINEQNINKGLVMPETLNWIFYDVIEDIFSFTFTDESELDNLLCRQQLGMTGLFAHLLGYYFEFPVMTNIENGRYGIGDFGLMDQGCFNQQGVIPAKPNPWTRSNDNGWQERDNKTNDLFINDEIEISVDLNKIFQFNIAHDEYFLIENRYNKLLIDDELYGSKSIDCIIDYYRNYPSYCDLDPSLENNSDYDSNNDDFEHLYDVIKEFGTFYNDETQNSLTNEDIFQIQNEFNVITKVNNYDYGLPGSGILIWHIKEPNPNDYQTGINNSSEDRAIVLEEADGLQQIGGPDYEWFPGIDYTQGREFDFWYDGNEQYESINYPNVDDVFKTVFFNNTSIPNTRTHDNLNSYLSFKITDSPSNSMDISVKFDYSDAYTMEYIKENIHVIGNSPNEGCVFYTDGIDIGKKCYLESEDDDQVFTDNANNDSRVLVKNDNYHLVSNSNIYIDANNEELSFENFPIYPKGYYSDLINLEEVTNALSLGDIDLDGYDERLSIDENNTLHCYNYNDTYCPGFPVYGLFADVPLIVDILEEDGPEIIVKNGNYVSIISHEGNLLLNIPSYGEYELQIVPNWGNSNTACLVNGNRLFIFDNFNSNNSYWYNYHSTSYNYPEVGIPGPRENTEIENNVGIDLDRTYNYPNPIEDGYTKFRFFVHEASKVSIKIYDSLGFLIKKIESNALIQNEYNEIYWDASNVDSGLYFADIQSNLKESKLIKVVVIK